MLVLTPHMKVIDQLAFGHDGKRLYAAGSNVPDLRYKPDNRGIDVWDVGGGLKPVDRFLPDQLIAGFAVNPAGGWLYASTGFEPYYGELEDEPQYFAIALTEGNSVRLAFAPLYMFVLAVHPSGRWFVAASYEQPPRRSVDGPGGRLVRWDQPESQAPVEIWQVESDNRYTTTHLACDAEEPRIVARDLDHGRPLNEIIFELQLRDAQSGNALTRVPIPGRTVEQLLFSPDGSRFVLRAGKSFLVWNASDFNRKPHKVAASKLNLTGIAFHPSGRYLAATSNDTTVKLYDTESWQVAKTFTWNVGRLRSVAFSPDGTLAAVGSDTGKIIVWDVDL